MGPVPFSPYAREGGMVSLLFPPTYSRFMARRRKGYFGVSGIRREAIAATITFFEAMLTKLPKIQVVLIVIMTSFPLTTFKNEHLLEL